MIARVSRSCRAFGAVVIVAALAGCSQSTDVFDDIVTSALPRSNASASERECLARAMFFESNRSSRDGLVAVGTVVMNRLDSGQYADTICGVVGQKNQFAPGVLSRPMNSKALPDVMAAADAVLAGERHPAVKKAQFFHQAGLKFPYKNMHYVLEAGGNAFYEKRSRRGRQPEVTVAAVKEKEPDAVSSVAVVTAPAPVLSFDVAPQAADAIGAMLSSQIRPTN